MKTLSDISNLLDRVKAEVLGTSFQFYISRDKKDSTGRIYIQVKYMAKDTKDASSIKEWNGRKWYLSDYMTDDEVIKTAYCAVKAAVEHEVMEGFKVDNIVLFNPHVNFEALLSVSHKTIERDNAG